MGRVNLGDVDAGKPVATKKKREKVINNVVKETREEILDVTPQDYEEDGEEFSDMGKSVGHDSDLRHVIRDLDSVEGIEGKTELTEDMATLILNAKIYEKAYPGLGFDHFSKWFNIIRLSVGGKGRLSKVEILKGNVSLQPVQGNQQTPPNRGF